MEQQFKFRDFYINNLKSENGKQLVKREIDGFAIRVLPTGHKTWLFIYNFGGKRRQMNLGDYPSISLKKAKERFVEARKALQDGKDPQEVGFEWHKNPKRERAERARLAEENRKNPTVKQLATEYLEKHAKVKKRSWAGDERIINKDVLPEWGERKAADIKKRDVVLLLEKVMARGPAMSKNVFSLVRKMFSFAVERDILEYSPCAGVKSPAPQVHRERTLSEDELKALLTTELPKAAMSADVKRALKLILITGQRPGEVAGLHSREIDGDWWTIPPERSKNKQAHRVFLTKMAKEIIGEAKGYIFLSPKEKKEGPIEVNALAYAVRRNLKDYTRRRPAKGDKDSNAVKMVKVDESKKMAISHFTPHDLRRTSATFLAQLGFSDETIDSVLGHKKQGIVKVYNRHRYDKERQQAMEAWERKLKTLLAEKQEKAKVIPMRRRSKGKS